MHPTSWRKKRASMPSFRARNRERRADVVVTTRWSIWPIFSRFYAFRTWWQYKIISCSQSLRIHYKNFEPRWISIASLFSDSCVAGIISEFLHLELLQQSIRKSLFFVRMKVTRVEGQQIPKWAAQKCLWRGCRNGTWWRNGYSSAKAIGKNESDKSPVLKR